MREIYQRCHTDCFPTCVAMVANISHRQAIQLIHPFHVKGQDYLTFEGDAVRALRFLGFKVRKRYLKDFTQLKNSAIVIVNGADYRGDGHTVVWDPESQRIIDPARNQNVSLSFYQERTTHLYIVT